ncbi:hypothetical protein H8959_011282 [Pygathrix nigripes]
MSLRRKEQLFCQVFPDRLPSSSWLETPIRTSGSHGGLRAPGAVRVDPAPAPRGRPGALGSRRGQRGQPAPGRRRPAESFAPSEETKCIFVRCPERRVGNAGQGPGRAGRRSVRGPSARVTDPGLSPLRAWCGPEEAGCGAWPSWQPSHSKHGSRPALAPAEPRRFARYHRGLSTSLYGLAAGREGGKREPAGVGGDFGSAGPPLSRQSAGRCPPSLSVPSRGGSPLQQPRASPAQPRRRAAGRTPAPSRPCAASAEAGGAPGPALAQCGRPSLLVPHPREGQRGGRSIRGIEASEGAGGEENGVTETRGGWGVGGSVLREGGGGTQREEEAAAAAAAPLCRGGNSWAESRNNAVGKAGCWLPRLRQQRRQPEQRQQQRQHPRR